MKKYVKGLKWNMLVMAALTIVMGGALIANPDAAALTICRLLGWIILISGVVSVIFYLRGGRSPWETTGLVLAIVGILLGIYIIRTPGAIVKFIGYLMAVILLAHGINDVKQALEGKTYHDPHWVAVLILGVVSVLLGLLILWNPFSSAKLLMTVVGVALVYDGVTELLIVLRLAGLIRKAGQSFQDDIVD